jgi:hypothetical protein
MPLVFILIKLTFSLHPFIYNLITFSFQRPSVYLQIIFIHYKIASTICKEKIFLSEIISRPHASRKFCLPQLGFENSACGGQNFLLARGGNYEIFHSRTISPNYHITEWTSTQHIKWVNMYKFFMSLASSKWFVFRCIIYIVLCIEYDKFYSSSYTTYYKWVNANT